MKFRLVISILSAVSVLGACGDPPMSTVTRDYLPVAVGNRWVYNEIDVAGIRDDQTDVKEITGTADYEGMLTFIMTSTPSTSGTTKHFKWRVTDERVTRVRSEDWLNGTMVEYHTYRPNLQGFLRYSTKLSSPGDSISEEHHHVACNALTNACVDKNKPFVWTVVALDEVITVPAGTFSCIKIRRTRAAGNFKEYWYAEGVGKVYEVGLGNYEELLEYTIVE